MFGGFLGVYFAQLLVTGTALLFIAALLAAAARGEVAVEPTRTGRRRFTPTVRGSDGALGAEDVAPAGQALASSDVPDYHPFHYERDGNLSAREPQQLLNA